jgi:hypothetical protein
MPVMDFFEVPATARASFAMYNTKEEVDVLINGIDISQQLRFISCNTVHPNVIEVINRCT